jgi:hypothetical protein
MKSIINGKTYNTETAELIVTGDNGLSYGDCYRRTEELYLTKKGNYFICTAGEDLVVVQNGDLLGCEACEIATIHEWLGAWNISDLEEREMKAFDIEEA